MTTIRFSLYTNTVGSERETTLTVDDDEWAELSEDQRDEYATAMFLDNAFYQLGGWSWEATEDDTP